MKITKINNPTPFCGTVLYKDKGGFSNELAGFSYGSASEAEAYVKAFNTFKKVVEKNTPDSFVCTIDGHRQSKHKYMLDVKAICFDSDKKDECEFNREVEHELIYMGPSYYYKLMNSTLEGLAKRIISYANSDGNRKDNAKINYATNYRCLSKENQEQET